MSPTPQPTAPFELPAPLGRLLGHLPPWPGSLLFALALNLALARQLPADVGQALRDRRLRIRVRDACLVFDFAWAGGQFVPRVWRQAPDLTVSASAADFLALARREQDPDTLFFSRRLAMEGDTELGLMVKNALDAMALPLFDPQRLGPPALRALLARLGRPFVSR
jgi:predicted lipid carrier protein YhbT